jgi:short subunit dehydrogenase-like uncharacterized protein
MTGPWLLYGANGYTGELVARLAAVVGHRPVLAGRNAGAVCALAEELGLERRLFGLDEPARIEEALAGMTLVLHCAGPFSRTSKAMADACLRTRTHYLDLTGEIAVIEALAARDAEARAAGVMLLPGCGFDVVPSDCLALHLKTRLPGARRLSLGFETEGGTSRGTAATAIESLHRGGLVRRQGRLAEVPSAWKTRRIDLGGGPRTAVTIPWGDVATAWYSTGIPDIEVYWAAPLALRVLVRASRHLKPILASNAVRRLLAARVRAAAPGPSEEQRRRGRAWVWGEVEDAEGRRAVSRLATPEGYTLTGRAALALVERVLAGHAPAGFETPAKAYGADFVIGIPGVTRTDEPSPADY